MIEKALCAGCKSRNKVFAVFVKRGENREAKYNGKNIDAWLQRKDGKNDHRDRKK